MHKIASTKATSEAVPGFSQPAKRLRAKHAPWHMHWLNLFLAAGTTHPPFSVNSNVKELTGWQNKCESVTEPPYQRNDCPMTMDPQTWQRIELYYTVTCLSNIGNNLSHRVPLQHRLIGISKQCGPCQLRISTDFRVGIGERGSASIPQRVHLKPWQQSRCFIKFVNLTGNVSRS